MVNKSGFFGVSNMRILTVTINLWPVIVRHSQFFHIFTMKINRKIAMKQLLFSCMEKHLAFTVAVTYRWKDLRFSSFHG